MSSEALLLLLFSICSLILMAGTVTVSWKSLATVKEMSRAATETLERQTERLAALAEQQSQLLASKTSRDFEAIRDKVHPPQDPFADAATYYTGEAKQAENERLTGTLNDDELTALEGVGY